MHLLIVLHTLLRFNTLTFAAILLFSLQAIGQNCPYNIGFEQGNFQNWECEQGNIATDGSIILNPTEPVLGRHEIIQATSFLVTDYYGDFPVIAPNGSGYSVRLGNTVTGTQADRVSYTFTVPQNSTDYSIIYNYAVVFFNPPNNHVDFEQPRFTVNVFDVSANEYTHCGSFNFVSSSDLPGFQQSKISSDVYFKPWAPITLNLLNYAGKTIRLEFTVNGCTKENGRHFGYAYIDVNENCDSPISGNIICNPSSITLTAPAGFKEYYWYNDSDLSQELGRNNTLTISPSPPENTRYSVKIEPYPGLGCPVTLYTTTSIGKALTNFKVIESSEECHRTSVDLTKSIVGNDPGLKYTYFTDADATTYVRVPSAVVEDGIYYIKATNLSGCYLIKPVRVKINPVNLVITDPPVSCSPDKIDITNKSLIYGSDVGLTYTFWQDQNAVIPLTNPDRVDVSGTFYIKATNTIGCYAIKPIKTNIVDIIVHNQSACKSVNLTDFSVTAGSSLGFEFTYWQDSLATINLHNPNAINASGTYYIKGSYSGCSKIVPVQVLVYHPPVVNISNPSPVTYPETVNLTLAAPSSPGLSYSYWKDEAATISLTNPETIKASGTYYIKTVSANGCSLISPVIVIIHEPPPPKVITNNTFTPNNDGINDFFTISMLGEIHVNYFRIYNRWGQLVFSTRQISNFWDGTISGMNQPIGTYYWMLDGIDEYKKQQIKLSGAITLLR